MPSRAVLTQGRRMVGACAFCPRRMKFFLPAGSEFAGWKTCGRSECGVQQLGQRRWESGYARARPMLIQDFVRSKVTEEAA